MADTLNILNKYDLNLPSIAKIKNSGKSIIIANPRSNLPKYDSTYQIGFMHPDLQIGPDGKIYAASEYNGNNPGFRNGFLVINRPNLRGFECDIQFQYIDLGSGESALGNGLPNFIQNTFNGLEPRDCTIADGTCGPDQVSIFPNPAESNIRFKVESSCFEPYLLKLYAITGQQLLERKMFFMLSEQVYVGLLPPGFYLAELVFPTRRIVKKWFKL